MSEIINYFNIFRDFPPNFIQNIKLFHASRVLLHGFNFGYCVLNDNKVFGLGEEIQKILGYKASNEKYVLIHELCQRNIQEFYQGHDFMFARNEKNEIFSWGKNEYGQLGKGFKSNEPEYLRPEKVDFLDGKNIIEIICGCTHCMALTSDGLIYVWGYKSRGNVGFAKMGNKIITTLIEIDSREITQLNFTTNLEYIFLNRTVLNKLNKELKGETINDFYSVFDLDIFQIEDYVYSLLKFSFIKTPYKTIFEYCLYEFQITYKTIHLKENKLFVLDFKDISDDSEPLIKTYKEINSNVINQNDTSSSLIKFRFSKDLPQILESDVKCYYQSGGLCFYSDYFVMNDNKVYSFGYSQNGKLEIVHRKGACAYIEIVELRDKDIQEFFEGRYCMFARNDQNQIFSWGMNEYGELGRGYKSELSKPEKIDFFDGKNIIHISCGYNHFLALSSNGKIFGWGYNKYGQVGCGIVDDNDITTPKGIDLNEKIKFIHCVANGSIAISFDGRAYFWGIFRTDKDSDDAKPFFIPEFIPLKNVLKVYYYFINTFNILDTEGKLYLFNIRNKAITKIICEENITDLFFNYCLLSSEDYVYRIENMKLIKTDFINFFDCSQNIRYDKKTIEITKDGYLKTKQIKFDYKKKILIIENQFIFERKYENSFDEIKEIGKGGFGTVFEVKKKSNNILYAIKRIEITNDLNINEIKIVSKLNTDFVVHYIDSWIEGKVLFKKIIKFQFIQMELCSHNLRDFIKLMGDIIDDRFNTFKYFISCELFKELIECVNYLHSLKPPIIHRDLKPENILISDGINGRFIKLCDFGLAKIHETSVNASGQGTLNYIAPEVRDSQNYNPKSDIYSLALIATEIFHFEDKVKKIRNHEKTEDFDKYLAKYLNSILKTKAKNLLRMLSKCLIEKDYHLRPDCSQLLENIKEIIIYINYIWIDENISEFESFLDTQDNYSLKSFFDKKIIQKFENQYNITFSYSECPDQFIEKIISIMKEHIRCAAICTNATSYIVNLQRLELNISAKSTENMVEAILLTMKTHPTNLKLHENILSIMTSEYILENITLNWSLCIQLILNSLDKFINIDINCMAVLMICNLKSKLSENELSFINKILVYTEEFSKKIRSNFSENQENKLSDKTIQLIFETTLVVMKTYTTIPKLNENGLSIMSYNNIHENINLNWFLCAQLVLDFLLQFKKTDMNSKALHIFCKIKPKLSENELSCICQKCEYINAIINIIRKRTDLSFENNKEHYILIKNTLDCLVIFTDESYETSELVYSNGGLDLWLNILKEFDYYSDLINSISRILVNIAKAPKMKIQFISDELLLIFSSKMLNHIKSTNICTNLTCLLLCITYQQESKFNVKSLEEMVKHILQVIKSHPYNEKILNYSLIIMSSIYILENINFNWFHCAQLVLDTLLQIKETHINFRALYIFCKIRTKLSENELSCIFQKNEYIEVFINMFRNRNDLYHDTNEIYYFSIHSILECLIFVTYESHETSELLLSNGGLDLLIDILKEFDVYKDKSKYANLIGPILMILNNMAIVSKLRTKLLSDQLLLILREMIKSPEMLISHSTTAILVNLCIDKVNWNNSSLNLIDILNDLEVVILKWESIRLEFVIYTAFISIKPLLSCFESPIIQLWAVWTLHHLLSLNPNRYYEMLVNIDGITTIESIIEKSNEESEVKKQLKSYCRQTLDLIRVYKTKNRKIFNLLNNIKNTLFEKF